MEELIRKQDVLNEIGEWIDASKDNRHEQSASDLRLVRNSIKEMPPANNRLIQKIEEGIKATGTADVYSVGMCNGMKWCKSLIDGKEPLYENCPSAQSDVPDTNAGDMISKQAAIYVASGYCHPSNVAKELAELPSVQPETCEGCKHLGKWENEVEYGYPSPCTRCKRRTEDHYER